MTYILSKFDLEGNFYGFETLTDQLLICQTSSDVLTQLRRFGTSIDISCQFDLSALVSASPYDHPKNENMFYELFLQDYNGDLIDVPVLITNFQDASGNLPNSNSAPGNE